MERIEEVKFFASGGESIDDGVMMFAAHTGSVPVEESNKYRIDKAPFLEWCREHGLVVMMQHSALVDLYDGRVRFETADQRFEFKMRWNV